MSDDNSTRVASGTALVAASSLANQTGAALGALAFPVIGPVGVVAVRQLATAAIFVPAVRPRLSRLHRGDWLRVTLQALVFSAMNISLYFAVERIGLGLSITLEFLGPLTVAILGSRRPRDLAAAALALSGVVVLARPGPSTDWFGIALALLAAMAWGSYILLSRSLGARLPGLEGTAVSALLACALWLPIAIAWFLHHPPTPWAIGLATACGLLSSVVPYAADTLALRRIPANLFGTLTSLNPVWAALAGVFVLHQPLTRAQWAGIVAVGLGNLIVTSGRRVSGEPTVPRGARAASRVTPAKTR